MSLSVLLAGLLTGKLATSVGLSKLSLVALLGTTGADTAAADPDDPAGTEEDDGDPIARAGESFLEGLSSEDRARPLADDGDELEPPPPAEAVTDVEDDEPISRETDGATWNATAERWVLNGKFVEGDAPEGWERPAVADDDDEPPPAAAADKPKRGADAARRIVLPGLPDRGEEDLAIEIDDPIIAERITRLQNDGMRKAEYQRRLGRLRDRESALEAFEQSVEVDPVGYHLSRIPKAQQLDILRALTIEHFDEIAPELEQFHQDPAHRQALRVQLRDAMTASATKLSRVQTAKRFASECLDAVEQLVPETVTEDRADRFLRAAKAELAAASEAGKLRRVEDVTAILAGLVDDYGFARRTPPAPVGGKKPTPPVARPVTDRARDIAARRPATPPADVAASQSRIRRVQDARAAGRRVAPPGAGAAPTQVPTIPAEAEADIATATAYLRKSGKLQETWQPRER